MALGRCTKEASVAWHIEKLVFPSECCLWLFILLIAIYSQVLMASFLQLYNRSDWSKLLSNSVGCKTFETRSSGHRSKFFRPVTKGYVCLVAQSCPTLQPVDCSPPGFSVHGDSPGKNTGVYCHALFGSIFSTEGSKPGLLHCGWILYHLSHQGSPKKGWIGLIWGPIDSKKHEAVYMTDMCIFTLWRG